MPRVILKLDNNDGVLDPPTDYVLVDFGHEEAAACARLVEFANGLDDELQDGRAGSFSGLVLDDALAVPFNNLFHEGGHRRLIDAETEASFAAFAADPDRSYFVLPDAAMISVDNELCTDRYDGKYLGVSPSTIHWRLTERHSAAASDTPAIHYWQLAAWAGWLTLPRPVRAIRADPALYDQTLAAHPVPARDNLEGAS